MPDAAIPVDNRRPPCWDVLFRHDLVFPRSGCPMVRKRRTLVYTLPVIVLIGAGGVVAALEWQRSQVMAKLIAELASDNTSEAAAAARKLAASSHPPLAALVEAAACERFAVAQAAQHAINGLLGQWQREAAENSQTSRIAPRVAELALQLARHRHAFGPRDYPWLASATCEIVRVTNMCHGADTPLVARHCDEVAAVIGTNWHRNAAAPPATAPAEQQASRAGATDDAAAAELHRAPLESAFAEFPGRPLLSDSPQSSEQPGAGEAAAAVPKSDDDGALNDHESLPNARAQPAADGAGPPNLFSRNGSPDELFPATEANVGPDWSMPMMRMVPARPAASAPPKEEIERQPAGSAAVAANGVSTHELLKWWRAGNETQRCEVERLLAPRGLKKLPPKLVEQCLCEDVQQRLRLAGDVMKEPGLDGRPWLMLLAEDESAEVRLAAVTLMMTSDDSALIDKAWEVSIHDRDPRVADLAARLRDRRMARVRR